MSSRHVRTANLVALIDITSERLDQAIVSADVVVRGPRGSRGNAHVVLEGGDRLVASCGDEQRDMQSLGNGSYEARFAHSRGEFVVGLARDAAPAAPRSVGTLPTAFEITSGFGDRVISRANDTLTLTWAPGGSGADVTVELEGDCVHSEEFLVSGDPGALVIESGRLTAWKSQEDEVCGVALRVVRTGRGQPDPHLDANSSVVLRQIRSTRFISGP